MQKAHAIIVFLLLACVSAVAGASEAAVINVPSACAADRTRNAAFPALAIVPN